MPRLTPCPSCHVHVLSHESSCPHCSSPLRSSSVKRGGAAVLMGLALTACPDAAEPEYGVPDTTTESGTATTMTTTGESEYGVPDTGSEAPDTDTDTDTAAEPEYGVPDTSSETGDDTAGTETGGPDTAGEPEYGSPVID